MTALQLFEMQIDRLRRQLISAAPLVQRVYVAPPPVAPKAPTRRYVDRLPRRKRRIGDKHGTLAEYTNGCRCDDCKIANALYQRMYHQQRKAQRVARQYFTSHRGLDPHV